MLRPWLCPLPTPLPSLLLHTVLGDSIPALQTHFPPQTHLLKHTSFSHCRAHPQGCDALLEAGAVHSTPPVQGMNQSQCPGCAVLVQGWHPNPILNCCIPATAAQLSPLQAGTGDLLKGGEAKKIYLNSVRGKQLAQIQSQLTLAAPRQLAHACSAVLSTANIFLEELCRVLLQALECS